MRWWGGVIYDPNSEFGLSDSSFFNSAGGLSGSVMGFVGQGETYNELPISMPGGSWTLNFTGVIDQQDQGNDTYGLRERQVLFQRRPRRRRRLNPQRWDWCSLGRPASGLRHGADVAGRRALLFRPVRRSSKLSRETLPGFDDLPHR